MALQQGYKIMLSSQMDGGIHQTNYYFHGQGGKQFFIWLQLLKKWTALSTG